MNTGRFDVLLRSMSGTPTRRRVGRGLTGLAVGGVLGSLFGLADADGKKKHKKNKRKKRKKKNGKPFNGDPRCRTKPAMSTDGECVEFPTDLEEIVELACETGDPSLCLCAIVVNGGTECVDVAGSCVTACESNADCQPGHVCIDSTGCCPTAPELIRSCAALCP